VVFFSPEAQLSTQIGPGRSRALPLRNFPGSHACLDLLALQQRGRSLDRFGSREFLCLLLGIVARIAVTFIAQRASNSE
jgi:hypothetical protein